MDHRCSADCDLISTGWNEWPGAVCKGTEETAPTSCVRASPVCLLGQKKGRALLSPHICFLTSAPQEVAWVLKAERYRRSARPRRWDHR